MERLPAQVPDEREHTIARLTTSFARDEISLEEFERRVARAYDAATLKGLHELTADLPIPAVTATNPAHAAPIVTRITAVLSNAVTHDRVTLPERLHIRSWAGNVELDFRDAQPLGSVVEIAVDVIMGNVDIKLPAGARVENLTHAVLGSFECRQSRMATDPAVRDPAPVTIRFTGHVVLGNVTVVQP